MTVAAIIDYTSPSTSALASDVKAGPIWNNDDAKVKCPAVCTAVDGYWHGEWITTVEGSMSVCGCDKNRPAAEHRSSMPTPGMQPSMSVGNDAICTNQISIRFLPDDGSKYSSASNARILALHNISASACKMSWVPEIVFRDASGKPLPISRHNQFRPHYGGQSMGHGPAVPMILIPAGRTATIPLSWNESGSICFDTRSLTVEDGASKPEDAGDLHGLLIQTRMCGETTDYIEFSQGTLTLDSD